MLRQIDLLTLDSRVGAPEGIIYSTSPRRAEGSDNASYFVKGPEPEVVFAELAGCLLAMEVGLSVPEVAVCRYGETIYCGSCKVTNALRDVSPWLKQPLNVRNFGDLYDAIVVDAWLANNDRNLGNVLGRPAGGSEIELVMIDFEKSKALRPNPLIESGQVDSHSLWPTGELGGILRQRKPLTPPAAIVERVREIGRNCASLIAEVGDKFGPVEWAGNCTEALSRRAVRIDEIVRQVWTSH
jgi:hypothetical protein